MATVRRGRLRTADQASRALEQAASRNLQESSEILRANITRYRRVLSAGSGDVGEKRIVKKMLADAEAMLGAAKSRRWSCLRFSEIRTVTYGT